MKKRYLTKFPFLDKLVVILTPIIAWLISGFSIVTLLLCVVAPIAYVKVCYSRTYPYIFTRSGNSKPASVARKLNFRRQGGQGGDFFCDPVLAFASIEDFSYNEGPEIDFETLLKEKAKVINLYCLDDEHQQVVLVETPEGFDPAEVGPFFFQSQRSHAIAAYVVPYREFHRVAKKLDNAHTDNVLFVYNTSRCGSTLLSKLLDRITGIQSISEPDIFTSITHISVESKGKYDNELVKLASSSLKVFCHLRRKQHPEHDAICIKPRWQVVNVAKLIYQASPKVKGVFLYRNGHDVIDSMGAAFINTGAYRFLRAIKVDILYVYDLSDLMVQIWKLMPIMLQYKQRRELGACTPLAWAWLNTMDQALAAHRAGIISVCFRYEEMVVGKVPFMKKVLETARFRLPSNGFVPKIKPKVEKKSKVDLAEAYAEESAGSADEAFNVDPHGNSVTGSKRRGKDGQRSQAFAYFRPTDVEIITQFLAIHPEINHSGYIIPGTIMP